MALLYLTMLLSVSVLLNAMEEDPLSVSTKPTNKRIATLQQSSSEDENPKRLSRYGSDGQIVDQKRQTETKKGVRVTKTRSAEYVARVIEQEEETDIFALIKSGKISQLKKILDDKKDLKTGKFVFANIRERGTGDTPLHYIIYKFIDLKQPQYAIGLIAYRKKNMVQAMYKLLSDYASGGDWLAKNYEGISPLKLAYNAGLADKAEK